MEKAKWFTIGMLALVMAMFNNCSEDTEDPIDPTDTTDNTTDDPLEIYKMVYGASDVYLDGNYVVIKTTGVPDHKSPYFKDTQWESTKWEAGTVAGFHQNPNKIAALSYVFRIPKNPQEATNKSATAGGPIGVSLNGVPFFNQYAAQNAALTNEIVSFDQYNGHPAQAGDYHYHMEPKYLTTTKGKSALLGFLLDGFPVYGPTENGATVTNADLDDYHGHKHATTEYPDGIYHYHITSADPYINGDGYFGTPGTVSK